MMGALRPWRPPAAAAAKPAPQLTMPDKKRREGLFREMDVNGNGGLSLAEIDKAGDSGVLGRALNCPTFRRGQAESFCVR